jgi:hypothetical protein
MSASNPDPTERIPVTPAPVAPTRRIGGTSALSVSALLIAGVVVAAAIALRPGLIAGEAASTNGPSGGAPAAAATPGTPAASVDSVESAAATDVATAAPTPALASMPATPKPTKHPTPTPTVPADFTADLMATASCSTGPGMEGVSLTASFAGPDFITRVVLFMDGVQVAPIVFDPPGVQAGGAGSGTSVTPDVAHEATAAFYSGANGDVLVRDGVSSGSFTVALTADCG